MTNAEAQRLIKEGRQAALDGHYRVCPYRLKKQAAAWLKGFDAGVSKLRRDAAKKEAATIITSSITTNHGG